MTSGLQNLLERHVASGTVPGVVASFGTAEPQIVATGAMSVGGAPMRADAIMRLKSMTKAVTAVAALRLVEAGRLGLDEPVERWLPELADRRVLKSPTADLGDTSPGVRAITLRHLLTSTSGYGMVLTACPLQRALADSEIDDVGVDPLTFGADEWLARLAGLPLAFQPGEGWRYHHSFGILGILIARVAGRPLQDHLADDLLGPLGLRDTGLWVPADSVARLPASYRHTDSGFMELEPAAGGFYAGHPPFDVSHGELVSTVRDYTPFARMLADGGRFEGRQIVSEEHLRLMTSDQVPAIAKDAGQLLPGFLGRHRLGLRRRCRHRGRAGRPLRVVRRTGHQLLRRPRRHGRCPADPGRDGRTDADPARRVPRPAGSSLTLEGHPHAAGEAVGASFVTLRCVATVEVVQRDELSAAELAALLAWLEEAYGDPVGSWRRETWTDIGPGPHVMVRDERGELLAHACVDWIPVTVGEEELAAGYLEAVATRLDRRGLGFGRLAVEAAQREIGTRAEIGFLGTGEFAFYELLGWIRWTGLTSVIEPDGSITRTPEDDDAIMALLLPRTPAWVRVDLPIRRPRRDPDEAW